MKQCSSLLMCNSLILSLLLLGCAGDETDGSSEQHNSASETFSNAVQVQTALAEVSALSSYIEVRGVVEAYRKTTIAAEISASVSKRLVEPGDAVRAGQTLLALDSTMANNSLREAKAQRSSRKVELDSSLSELTRGKELIEKAFISKDQLEDLQFAVERARAQLQASEAMVSSASKMLSDSKVKAPFAGTAELVHSQQGDFVSPGTPVVTLADFSKLRIRAGVSTNQALAFSVGQQTEVSFASVGGDSVSGEIKSIGRIADPATGNYPMEVWLDGTELPNIREGMIASITANVTSQDELLSVPIQAVFRRQGHSLIFVVDGDGANNGTTARLVQVTTGRSSNGRVEVLSGLSENQVVVIDGQFALQDGARVSRIQ
ncbi:MAG: efflux RND transporter periplasmic adaptor subunit [Pseudomonadales bacterium]